MRRIARRALEVCDQRQLFLRRLHSILRVIVDRAERLLAQGSRTQVVHQRRIQRRRIERAGNTTKQDDARGRRIPCDSDVGRQRTHDADGRVFGNPRSARGAVVEAIVDEEGITGTLEPHVLWRERACTRAVTRFTRSAVSPERLLPEQPSATDPRSSCRGHRDGAAGGSRSLVGVRRPIAADSSW